MLAGDGNDNIKTGDGYDTVTAGSGNDSIDVGLGGAVVDGGAGIDTLTFDLGDTVKNLYYGMSTTLGNYGISYWYLSSFEELRSALVGATAFYVRNGPDVQYSNVEAVNWTAGSGNDLLFYQGGSKYDGGAGIDTFYADFSGTAQVVNWNADTNSFTPVDGVTVTNMERFLLSTGSGNDIIKAMNGGLSHHVETGAGNDTLNLGAGNDEVLAGDGNDTINTGGGYDNITGGIGNDTINGGERADTMIGGDGNDIYFVDNTYDVVTETNASSTIGGVDLIQTSISYDLSNTDGTDAIGSNVENLRLLGTTDINAIGNSLNNTLYANNGINIIDGGNSIDTLSYYYTTSTGAIGVTLNLSILNVSDQATASGASGADLIRNIENITGSKYADTLIGNNGNNILNGSLGNDTLNGGLGPDTLIGGDGNDSYYVDNIGDKVNETNATASTGGTDIVYSYLNIYTLGTNVENGRIATTTAANLTGNTLNNNLYANSANNIMDSGTGIDTLSYLYGTIANTGVTVSLATTSAQTTVGSGSDTVLNFENLIGSNYNDKLTGNSGNNILNGGLGNDIISGGAGKDTLMGGNGNDSFDFNALNELNIGINRDVITDFTRGQDKIDLATIDSNTSITGNQAYSFVTSFTAAIGQIRYNAGIIYFNTDADIAAEYEIQLAGVIPTILNATDFVL